MFKQKDSNKTSGSQARNMAPSLLSADLTINGNLNSEGDIQVDGKIEGDIKSAKLTISETAMVRGSIEAETIVVAGEVTGQVKARHVTLLKSARVIADVVQERLTIEPGAFFEGNCRHFPEEEPASRDTVTELPGKTGGASILQGPKPGVLGDDPLPTAAGTS